jgi:chemotaxis protein CheD
MDFRLITVGIADMRVSRAPDILRTILGSCVGICLYDNRFKIGGMSHIMLPVHKENSSSHKKYADTAIPILIEELVKAGADANSLTAKIVGGAKMFNITPNSIMGEIGNNNADKVRSVLKSLRIDIVSEDIGGNYGRTIDYYLETGDVRIRSMSKTEKVI